MQVPLMDLGRQIAPIRAEIDAAIAACIDDNRFVQGDTVRALEQDFAAYCGSPHVIGCGSGTDALYLALRALRIGPGDEVIVPAMTFAATLEAVDMLGARPVIVDVRNEDLTIDVQAVDAAMTPATRAVIPVHLYGRLADVPGVAALAGPRGARVIADSAQAHGASRGERRPESGADIGCYSFYPGKNLGALGDAGACATSDADLARDMDLRRNHGRTEKYLHEFSGVNMRMDEIQAAVLRVKLQHLPAWTEARRRLASAYLERLAGVGDLALPRPDPDERPAWHLFTVETDRRDALKQHLADRGVGTGVHYPIALHEQPAFRTFATGPCPVAERKCRRVLSLPMFETMTEAELAHVAASVRSFF